MTAALNEWQTSKNAKAALQKLGGKSHCLEGLLLEGLAKHGSNDIVNALSMVSPVIILPSCLILYCITHFHFE